MARQIQRFDADHDYSMKAKSDGYWVRWEDVAPYIKESGQPAHNISVHWNS
ncbi:MAG: hypothetical protein NT096_00270 [Proteobacteria bacterium]|nr:hypothetical protein [Pseudomonadota bacterium]